jgi:hypothetical protein
MSPQEFVRARFYTEALTFLDHVNDGLDSLGAKSTSPYPLHPILSANGRLVLFVAYYNDLNYYQLSQPRQNLQIFCEADRHGRWQVVKSYDDDPAAAARYDRAAVHGNADGQTFERPPERNRSSGFTPDEAKIAENAGIIAARLAATGDQGRELRVMDGLFNWRGMHKAIQDDAFGVFRCDEPASAWSVSVLPQSFYAEDPSNVLEAAVALLVIRPYGTDEQPR